MEKCETEFVKCNLGFVTEFVTQRNEMKMRESKFGD